MGCTHTNNHGLALAPAVFRLRLGNEEVFYPSELAKVKDPFFEHLATPISTPGFETTGLNS